jgi:ubiquinone/menaquinone biosynthesis C-methylase UbiE
MPPATATIPEYLNDTYWWAYVHPNAVKFFERQWLVNLILWGNFAKLRNAALGALGDALPGRTLQVACVYGDFTPKMVERAVGHGVVDVVDVVPAQLANLRRKLAIDAPVTLLQRDASNLGIASASYDRVILFFLLHEMPEDVRRKTLAEAVRVLKPGAQLVIVDYHQPSKWHPLRPVMKWILENLEPFAMDLWRHELTTFLPPLPAGAIRTEHFFGGLYQKLVITKPKLKAV